MPYPSRSSSLWVRAVLEEHELADVAWALGFLLSRTAQGQVTREMNPDEAQVLTGLLKAVMEKSPERHLPSAYVKLRLVAQGETGLQTQEGEGDFCKMNEQMVTKHQRQ